jgi:hypothetical protein
MLMLRRRIRVEYGPPHEGTCDLLGCSLPSYHTVVDDALQISHCFDSLFLFSLDQVRLVALSVFAIGENLPRGNLQLSVSLLQGAAAVSVARAGHCAIRRLRPWRQRRRMSWRDQVGRGV